MITLNLLLQVFLTPPVMGDEFGTNTTQLQENGTELICFGFIPLHPSEPPPPLRLDQVTAHVLRRTTTLPPHLYVS